MEYLEGITASSSLDLHPEFEGESLVASAERRPAAAGKRDFLASLNQGTGRELLDAYIENRTDANRNALAMHYGLCAQVVARQVYRALTPDSRRQVDVGDAEQAAMALLFQLVEKFDCSLGIPLSAFLTRRLRYALIDEYRRLGLMVRAGRCGGERPKCVPLERGGKVMAAVDPSRGPAARLEEREARRALLREVPREHRVFAFYRFVRGMQLWQVAKRLNMTCERANAVQQECLVALRTVGGRKLNKRRRRLQSSNVRCASVSHARRQNPWRGGYCRWICSGRRSFGGGACGGCRGRIGNWWRIGTCGGGTSSGLPCGWGSVLRRRECWTGRCGR